MAEKRLFRGMEFSPYAIIGSTKTRHKGLRFYKIKWDFLADKELRNTQDAYRQGLHILQLAVRLFFETSVLASAAKGSVLKLLGKKRSHEKNFVSCGQRHICK